MKRGKCKHCGEKLFLTRCVNEKCPIGAYIYIQYVKDLRELSKDE